MYLNQRNLKITCRLNIVNPHLIVNDI